MSEVLHDGKGLIADAFVSSRLPYYQEVDRAIAKYPYDLRRAQQLMEEAGLMKGADGFYVGRDGAPAEIGFWSSGGAKNEQENTVMVDALRSAGFNARSQIYPAAQSRDAEVFTKTPGVLVWGGGGDLEGLENFTSEQAAGPQNRWRGTNYGAWLNPTYDQLFAEYGRSLAAADKARGIAQLNRILTEELPWIPYWYQPLVTAHVASLQGPLARHTPDAPSGIHKIHEWSWK
jgi:peptide/nickel transport system substrate-binding protein